MCSEQLLTIAILIPRALTSRRNSRASSYSRADRRSSSRSRSTSARTRSGRGSTPPSRKIRSNPSALVSWPIPSAAPTWLYP